MLEGMSASVEIILEKAEDVIVVPIATISDRGRESFVYTEEGEDTLSGEVAIETGISDETYVEIVSGLTEGDTIYYEIAGSQDSGNSNQVEGFGNFNGGMPGGGFNGEKPERPAKNGNDGGSRGGQQ